jgi:DNA-binding MurR/RpiR family transcriptional regulator
MEKSETAAPPRDFEALRHAIIAQKDRFPKRLAQAAGFALSSPDDMAFGTAASIALSADVQPSTLVRLAHHLGYAGFSDFQSVFRDRLKARTLTYDERLESLDRSNASGADSLLLHGFLTAAGQSLAKLSASLEDKTFSHAIRILAGAETIYLVARRRAYPVTAHMAYAFATLGIRHQMVASPNGIDADLVRFAGPKDAAIAISFSPYAPESIAQAEMLAGQGVPVIAMTDSAFSPLARLATTWLEVAEADFAGFRSLAASMSLGMAIPVAIAEKRRGTRKDA